MFSDRISRIQPSATLAMTSKAAELKQANRPVYNMSVGEPDFFTPKNIQNAGIQLCARSVHIDHLRHGIGSSELEIPHQREPAGNDDFAIVRIDFDAATTLGQGAYVQPVHSAFRCTSMHLKINQVRMSRVQAHADQSSKETSADCHRTQFHS